MPATKFPPTKKVTKAQFDRAGVNIEAIQNNCPSAGPYPNISGMRRIWGQYSYILQHGNYIYKVPAHIYDKF